MNEQGAILKVENLSAGYGNHIVLNGVSFTLQKGEVLAIIGQNGSGKSTLLKTLSGLLPKMTGSVWLNNQFEKHIAPHQLVSKGISCFLQGGLIMPALTVQEHLDVAAMQRGRNLGKSSWENIFAEFPKLEEMLNRRAGHLSGGERQMLSFALLQVQQTDTWLLDEPTAGLSPEMVRITADFLHRKNREGITMLLVEHNMDVAFRLATHIAITKETTLTRQFNVQEFRKIDFLGKFVYN